MKLQNPLQKPSESFEVVRKKRALYNAIGVFAVLCALLMFVITRNIVSSIITLGIILVVASAYLIIKTKMKKYMEIKKIEIVFPDFIELMASNLRAGMTIDRALLLSARKEFAPLDREIITLGKDLVTGKEIGFALKDMADRIGSEKIKKTIDLIISGIISGGNLSILLEEVAVTMRERQFVEKKAASNVLMYVIFIFVAAGIGAPVLFGLSFVLVKILTSVLASIPPIDGAAASKIPVTLTAINISTTFVNYYSIIFLIVSNILGSLVLGLVNKGEEREGIKYIAPLIILSLILFFVVKTVLYSYLGGFFT